MTKTNSLNRILLTAAVLLGGCDAPPSEAAERVAVLAEAGAPEQPREEIVSFAPDEAPSSACEFFGPDAVALDGAPLECDTEARVFQIDGPGGAGGPMSPSDDLRAPVVPSEVPCEEYTWKQYKFFDSPCNSCSYQPNMPGWKRAVEYRWCNACGECFNWIVESVTCNPC